MEIIFIRCLCIVYLILFGFILGWIDKDYPYQTQLRECARAYNVFECEFTAIPKGEKVGE